MGCAWRWRPLHIGVAGIQDDALDVTRAKFEQVGEGVVRNLGSLPLIVLHKDAVRAFAVACEMDDSRTMVQKASAQWQPGPCPRTLVPIS
jgi:hypothetical protein